MMSELSVGHHRGGGGDRLNPATAVPGGLLGADYTVDRERYRIAKVYGGLNWTPSLRSPLTEPGVNAKVGEYIIAVNGVDFRAPMNIYAPFENTAGKIVDLTLASNPEGTGARTVQVVPIANEGALRNRAWVEGNLKKVDDASGGRIAYVYVPDTGNQGHDYFKRYFYPQAQKDAVIVDERFNGGGSYADYYIDILRRPAISYWAMRYGDDMKTPTASIQGPKAMLIDETAGSGGDMLPWMFHNLKMGPLIGKRTWGGLVGILGFPVLMDGGTITAPNFAIWTAEEGWVVENVGVAPDIEAEMSPAEVIAGHDPADDPLLDLVLAGTGGFPNAEEQRVFYVALTRARQRCFIVTDEAKLSVFVEELRNPDYGAWVTAPTGGSGPPPACRSCGGGALVWRTGVYGVYWRCRHHPLCKETARVCPVCLRGALQRVGESFQCHVATCGHRVPLCPSCRKGMLVRKDGPFGPFFACSKWKPSGTGPSCTFTRRIPTSTYRRRTSPSSDVTRHP
ncbi:hypothetical protein BH09GEM1_BH09GEM1_42170 [soil metagenome]